MLVDLTTMHREQTVVDPNQLQWLRDQAECKPDIVAGPLEQPQLVGALRQLAVEKLPRLPACNSLATISPQVPPTKGNVLTRREPHKY